jgi:hypothetical protein
VAKIIIELDTNNGDTLDTVRLALLGSAAMPNVAAQDVFDPNGYNQVFSEIQAEAKEYEKEMAETVELDEHAPRTVEKSPNLAAPFGFADAPLTEYDGDRKRGTAGPNGGRRTKAQIESDTLYFAQAEAAKADAAAARNPDVKPITFKTAEAAVAAMEAGVESSIATSEERVNPDDAVDEEAERPKPQGDLTLEDLRAAYVRYSNKFGAPAAIKDIRTILGCGVVDVPLNKIADGIAKIDAAIAAADIDAHLAATTAEPAAPATATKQDLLSAIMAYGGKYDGTDKPDAMTLTKEDLPKVFAQVFGAGVTGIGSLPEQTPEAYGKALAAIRDATEKNTFNRKVLA